MSITTDSTPMEQPKQIEGTTLGQLMQAVNAEGIQRFVAHGGDAGHGLWRLEKEIAR